MYIGSGKALISTVWGGMLIVPSQDLSVAPGLIINGIHEPQLTNYLGKTIKPGFTCVDVGANIGYFTVLMGHLVGPKGKVTAYEPDPVNHSFLLDNLSINCLRDRVTPLECAVYSSSDEIAFYLSTRFRGHASIHRHGKEYFHHYTDEITQVEVPAERLDSRFRAGDHIDLIKLDIEGGEYHALLGASDLIENWSVETWVFEVNPMMLSGDRLSFHDLLAEISRSHDAGFFTLAPDGEAIPTELDEVFAEDGNPSVVMRRRCSSDHLT
ncbi:MAG: FkbM family methyltransferase [Firmicutes bacterium]|jgi:FkbM family methyltransferase|nr:FkbM family methyltransferase [Bacillota bacterium]